MEKDRGGRERGWNETKSSHCDREHRKDVKKLGRLKSQVYFQMAWAPYLGNMKSDSLLRMPDSPVLVHFFNNMWPLFHSTGDWWKLCVTETRALGLGELHNMLEMNSYTTIKHVFFTDILVILSWHCCCYNILMSLYFLVSQSPSAGWISSKIICNIILVVNRWNKERNKNGIMIIHSFYFC